MPSFRTASADGTGWSNCSGCNNLAEGSHSDQTVNCVDGYNSSGMILPDRDDPPELEFCASPSQHARLLLSPPADGADKLTPFRVGSGSKRLAAHAMLCEAPADRSPGAHLSDVDHRRMQMRRGLPLWAGSMVCNSTAPPAKATPRQTRPTATVRTCALSG